MEKKQRLTGIDLFRGLAIYAVAILHSSNGTPVTAGWAGRITDFSSFAVPFFLATSFYLTISKIYTTKAKYSLKSRVTRLIVPYGIWTIVYLIYRGFKYWISHTPEQLDNLLQDPIALIFLGSAAYHLYFLPLLFTGTLLVKIAEYIIRKNTKLTIVIFLFILSIAGYQLLLVSGNSFEMGSSIAFKNLLNSIFPTGNKNPLLRLVLVEISWMIRCLPYIFMAMFLSYLSIEKKLLKLSTRSAILVFALFFALNAFGGLFLPLSVYELVRGYLALISAIALSNSLNNNNIIANLGLCSFGIYLMHLFIVEVAKTLINRVYPEILTHVSALSLLTFATVGFLISWIATAILINKNKLLSKLMFGV